MRRTCLLCFGFLFLGLAASQAQLVHLSVQGIPGFHRNFVSTPFYVTGESVMTLDLYYDPSLARQNPDDPEPVAGFMPTDSSENFFRIRVDSPPGQGWDVDFTRPLSSILATPDTLEFRFLDDESVFEEFNYVFAFTGPINWESLPIPPFPLLDLLFQQRDQLFFGGPEAFGFDHPDSHWNYGALFFRSTERFSAELVGGFAPVPEPSTYGIVGALGLGGVVWWRRRQASRATMI